MSEEPNPKSKNIKDILSGKKIPTFQPIDFDSPEYQEKIEEMLRQQKEILDRQYVDWNELNKFTIDI